MHRWFVSEKLLKMTSRKSEDNFKDKIKKLFRKRETVPLPRTLVKDLPLVVTAEILKDIGPESPGNNRIKTIKEFGEVVLKKKLEENAVEAIWSSIEDLLKPETLSERRRVALQFLLHLLEGQYQHLGSLRSHFFSVIQSIQLLENIEERLALFKLLSDNGKNLVGFEEEAGPFLLQWLPDVISAGKICDVLPLVVSVVKFNAAYMDEDVVSGFIKHMCAICIKQRLDESKYEEETKLCLDVLDVVMCYSYLPGDTLRHVVAALCKMLNVQKYCESSCELMRKLLGTHLGHGCIQTMCLMLQERTDPVDLIQLRGAIYYIGMALWGSRKVQFLKHTPSSVLPSYLQVLSIGNPLIAHEVLLSVQRLVKKYGKELPKTIWEIILVLLDTILKQMEVQQDVSEHPKTASDFHDILTFIEQLHEHGQFAGSIDRFFKIIEMCAAKRPESSVILLMSHLAHKFHPSNDNWIACLRHFLEQYFRSDHRTKIRMKALEVLSFILGIYKHFYEDDLANNIILPHLCHIYTDSDVCVRKFSVEILMNFAQSCSPQYFNDVVNIIEKVISQQQVAKQLLPLSTSENSLTEIVMDESHLSDVNTAITLLVDLFKAKLYTCPPGICVKLYDMLITHLSAHYVTPTDYTSHTAAAIRKMITSCLLNLRANVMHRMGFFDRQSESTLQYSPYITCNRLEIISPPQSPVCTSAVGQWCILYHLEYTTAFSLFIQCLENEKDWEVLKCVLENLPILLQNKAIVLSTQKNYVDTLCSQLCAMINDRQLGFPDKLSGLPDKFTRSDFHTYVLPVLAAIVTYHNYLEKSRQKELIKCLEFGMVSKCAKLCVNALRLCTLEMHEVMMRQLPCVLLQLSKISATISMAIPVLAFLSSIVRIPKMYVNFVEDEYMSVFAIALPYTNPFKFSHYTVSLAHHVIAIWFIQCRLPFRKGFVPFIQKGLKANVLQQFEEKARLALQSQNQDSHDRIRSGSYSEAAIRSRRRMQSGSAVARNEVSATVDEKLSQFHRELTETCTDLMARYAFGNFFPVPHRSHLTEFLLSGGQCQSWLVGNKVITITTSGSGTRVGNAGICDKCQATFQASEQQDLKSNRRRHRSAVAFGRSSSVIEPVRQLSQDDMTIPNRTSMDDMIVNMGLKGHDVGVQTGSSLTNQIMMGAGPLESLLLGMKVADSHNISENICNCWCTNWAEIYIRAPSGNLSWMMRIENEAGSYSVHDEQIPDITMLFASIGKNAKLYKNVQRSSQRIESGSIGEDEYETLYKQHFEQDIRTALKGYFDGKPISLGFNSTGAIDESFSTETYEVSKALPIPSTESAKNHDRSPSLKRSNSTPSIMSISSDNLSPKDSISDIVQFDLPQKQVSLKSDKVVKPNYAEHKNQIPESFEQVHGLESALELVQEDQNIKKCQMLKTPNATNISEMKKNVKGEMKDEFDKGFSESNEVFSNKLFRQLDTSVIFETQTAADQVGELPSSFKRGRGYTMSSLPLSNSNTSSSNSASNQSDLAPRGVMRKDLSKVGVSPAFVFLQLYYSGQLQVTEVPLLLPNNESTERSLKMLDHIYPYETHKIGVIYVGKSQCKDEKAILSNQYGSDRYMNFIKSLGTLFRLKDCNPQHVYLGGLDRVGKDGEFTYGWKDESIQLIFHIATLMPNSEKDPNCNFKKLHIGNDFVSVVYNDSDEDYKIGVITGQFNYVNIVIKPLDYESNTVTLQAKEDIAGILGHTDTKIISDANLAALVRQIGIHCNLASLVLQRQASVPQDPFANNWLERLRKIRRMRTTIANAPSDSDAQSGKNVEDFTQYV